MNQSQRDSETWAHMFTDGEREGFIRAISVWTSVQYLHKLFFFAAIIETTILLHTKGELPRHGKCSSQYTSWELSPFPTNLANTYVVSSRKVHRVSTLWIGVFRPLSAGMIFYIGMQHAGKHVERLQGLVHIGWKAKSNLNIFNDKRNNKRRG